MSEGVSAAASSMVCAGCGSKAPGADEDPYPFRCAHADRGDNIDHVLTRVLDAASIVFPRGDDPNPFVRFRQLLHSWHVARAHGMADADYVALVRRLDDEIARIDGRGFRITPFGRNAALSERLGFVADAGVWVKDETGNVSGSHKGRHLFGIMIYLRVLDEIGLVHAPLPALAIASCGNAALAAAVVARAAGRALQVFIPPDASPAVVDRLSELGAHLTICRRESGMRGDPTYLQFREAVQKGALPFCCQGTANGLTIEGGETLGFEMITAAGVPALDRVVIHVGGGALASAVIQSFTDAMALGVVARLPAFHAVQTRGAFPLKRAFDRMAGRDVQYAATHRSEFMWPWEEEPHSIAHGILDDETYDWLAIVKGMRASGGGPVVVDEPVLIDAYNCARETTGLNVDHTGAAGLAGLVQMLRDGGVGPREKVAVILSGVER